MAFKSILKWGLATLVSAGLVAATYVGLDQFKETLARQSFETLALQDAHQVEEELNLTLEFSEAVKSLYLSSNEVTNEEFITFTKRSMAKHPSFQAMAWVPVVRQEDRESFELKMQQSTSGYQITEIGDESLIGAQARDVYYPVQFVYPLTGNEKTVGFDYGSEIARLDILEHARDIDSAMATGKLIAEQSLGLHNRKDTFYLFLPIYEGEPADIYQRRDQLSGFVLSVISIPKLLATVIPHDEHVKIQLLEPDEIRAHTEDVFSFKKAVQFANRAWVVEVAESKGYMSAFDWMPYMGAAIVGLICLLFLTIFYSLSTRNVQANKIIKQKTDALSYFNEMLHSIQDVQKQFISHEPPDKYFGKMLTDLIKFTDSEFGFIAEVLYKDNQRYMRTKAISNIAWNYETRKHYQENAVRGLDFYNLDTLFGATIKTGELVIANDPKQDSRSGGLPEGHPELKAFMGIPFYAHNNLVGMAGIANREGGYSEELYELIKPFIMNCGHILQEYKLRLEHQKIEQENYALARNDTLTGLSNRVLFAEKAKQLIDMADRYNHKLAILYLDLDDFKPVNDQYGHDIGDLLLKEIASILLQHARGSDVIARIGGDEFIMVLPKIKHVTEAETVAQKIIEYIAIPHKIADKDLKVGVSIGIACFPDNGKTLDTLLKQADQAMYDAKSQGKNNFSALKTTQTEDLDLKKFIQES